MNARDPPLAFGACVDITGTFILPLNLVGRAGGRVAKTLKTQNHVGLLALVAANLAIFVAVGTGVDLTGGEARTIAGAVTRAMSAGVGLAVLVILNGILSANAKARLVSFRWHNPLPGSRAFTRYGPADGRVDMLALERACGPLPQNPSEQNTLWYQIYRSMKDDPVVLAAHRAFLFTRDYTGLSFLMLLGLGAGAISTFDSRRVALIYVVALVGQFAAAGQAARTYGTRFVTTVLALKSAARAGGETK